LPAELKGLALGPEWLERQPAEDFTVQVLATTDTRAIRSFLTANRFDRQVVIHPFQRAGEDWYAVLYGRFKYRQQATQAIEKLPAKVRSNNPWVRRIGELKAVARD
jgi:DamX protein